MQSVTYQLRERIAYITLNRPDKRNALDGEMVEALTQVLTQVQTDPDAKVIVLKATGPVFCAGADLAWLRQLQANTYEENLADSTRLKDLFLSLYTLPKVIIAQVQGHALAGGCGLVTACDLAFAVPEAKFGYTEVRIGFVPAIVMLFLLRKSGETRAKELTLSGEPVNAATALQYGLINFMVSTAELEDRVTAYARMLVEKNAAQAMASTKLMIARLPSMSLGDALSEAAVLNAQARGTAECRRGIAAFLNKEPLTW
jgi:methylglutaconyl-CoA hydratase